MGVPDAKACALISEDKKFEVVTLGSSWSVGQVLSVI